MCICCLCFLLPSPIPCQGSAVLPESAWQAPVLITPVINQSCCCRVEDSKLTVLLLLRFTIWKILYYYLVTFPCTFMLIHITVFFDLWQVFFIYNSVINFAALLSMVMNLRYSVNCEMGEGWKPFEEVCDRNCKQSNLFYQYRSEASIRIIWHSLFVD